MINEPDALRFLEYARHSLKARDRRSARRWAEKAAALDPDLVEAWLILAALASPAASVSHLQRALRLDPGNTQAQAGMIWARSRVQAMEAKQAQDVTAPHVISFHRPGSPPAASAPTAPLEQTPAEQAPALDATQPIRRIISKLVTPSAAAQKEQKEKQPGKSRLRFPWLYPLLGFILVSLLVLATIFGGGARSAFASRQPTAATPMQGAAGEVRKPTYTHTPTDTPTPTATYTPTPTDTPTPTPTNTPLPTWTPEPTWTPRPTIAWPTSTPFQPYSGDKWIDVDLSQQMLYAYEGDTIVASFVVSTGVAAFPTVVGQFNIYIKLESTLMAGDGYYLPNVPYTMYFYRGYGIHGTYWHNNFGTPMSHGCVNMYTPDAEWMFYWAPLGTLVNVHY